MNHVALRNRGDRNTDAVDVDENSYHEEADRKIASPIADKGQGHPLVRQQ